MNAGRDFDPLLPGTTAPFSIDLTGYLLNGATLSSAVWTCSLKSTDPGATPDASAATRIIGSPTITTIAGRTYSTQKLGNMIAGNVYDLLISLATSDGCNPATYTHVYCPPIS